MRQNLEDSLYQRFSWLGQQKRGLFSCGDGWYVLIADLLDEIEQHYKKNGADIQTMVIDDVKQKYSGLRFYVSNAIEGVYGIIFNYEEKSEKICERCGLPGSTYIKNNWLKTLCETCAGVDGYVKEDERSKVQKIRGKGRAEG